MNEGPCIVCGRLQDEHSPMRAFMPDPSATSRSTPVSPLATPLSEFNAAVARLSKILVDYYGPRLLRVVDALAKVLPDPKEHDDDPR